uniref:YonK protein n=1 Tax=virus sp. ctE0n6 TaxID=2827985 RepID=A0A8S5RG05_9VIRU|nr:MAG TPA: YonK protein [virus sp. ctE0n6]
MAAKKKISEKKITTTKLSIEGFLSLDELQGFTMEIEEEGEKDITEKLKTYNGQYGTLTWTVKEEEELE